VTTIIVVLLIYLAVVGTGIFWYAGEIAESLKGESES